MLFSISTLTLLAGFACAQFPVEPSDVAVVTSELNSEVQITYKEVPGEICETTPGVRTFSGYVHLPQSVLTDLAVTFDIHTYFIYFEARNNADNAPLVIYLAGGPGESSIFTAFNSEGGPCYVSFDMTETVLNPWSLNNDANVLYIDQPVGAGFSYTSLVNGTYNMSSNEITPLDVYDGEVPPDGADFGRGTYSNPEIWATTNTSISTARALWHFAEHWLTQFPEYKSSNKNLGIWGNSAGGFWAPTSAAHFDRKIKEASSDSSLREWTIDNVGITNGAVDFEIDMPFNPEFVYNNTYEPLISEEMYNDALDAFTQEGGCADLIARCRRAAARGDPDGTGTNETVNEMCREANAFCLINVGSTIAVANVSVFDIAAEKRPDGNDGCPYYFPAALYLNSEPVRQALGVPLNFTYISQATLDVYSTSLPSKADVGTGDAFRGNKSHIEYLLQNDVKVALVYGDRDSRCPWLAGENLALVLEHDSQAEYNQAGYEFIVTNDTYQGGAVRQFGGLSFSRVFQAGHSTNAYQPETVYRIFNRTLGGKDVATGNKDASNGYSTEGPSSSYDFVQQELPAKADTCMVLGTFDEISVLDAAASAQSPAEGDDAEGGSDSDSDSDSDSGSSSLSVKAQPNWLLALWALLAAGGIRLLA